MDVSVLDLVFAAFKVWVRWVAGGKSRNLVGTDGSVVLKVSAEIVGRQCGDRVPELFSQLRGVQFAQMISQANLLAHLQGMNDIE